MRRPDRYDMEIVVFLGVVVFSFAWGFLVGKFG